MVGRSAAAAGASGVWGLSFRDAPCLLSRCGDPLEAMSEELSFRTLQAPGPAAFPQRLGLIGDLGQTYNSSRTLQHVLQSDPPVRAVRVLLAV